MAYGGVGLEELFFRPGVELRNWRMGAGGTKEDISRPPAGDLDGLLLPGEDIFLGGSSSGRGGEEFISSQNSELGLTARYFRPRINSAQLSSGPADRPFTGQTGFELSSGPANVPFSGQTGRKRTPFFKYLS